MIGKLLIGSGEFLGSKHALGYVGHHDAQEWRASVIRHGKSMHMCPEWRAIVLYEPQLARLRGAGFSDSRAHQVKNVLIVRENEAGDLLSDEYCSLHTKQPGGSEVDLLNQSRPADGAIAHWRHVVEIEIACLRRVQFILSPAQFLVLHLQLDLMHPQFMQCMAQCLGRHGTELSDQVGCATPVGIVGATAQALLLTHGLLDRVLGG